MCQALCNALFFFFLTLSLLPETSLGERDPSLPMRKRNEVACSRPLQLVSIRAGYRFLRGPGADEFGFNKGLPYNASVTWNGSRVGFPVRPAHHPI